MDLEAKRVLTEFRNGEYGRDDRAAPLHIGERHDTDVSLDWITAWNPLGRVRERAANEDAQRELLAAIVASGHAHVSGYAREPGATPDHGFCEPCAVVIGAPAEVVDAIARRFRQLATVRIDTGGSARLRCFRALWRERFGCSDMDARDVDWVA
jgi:hypothetical protein